MFWYQTPATDLYYDHKYINCCVGAVVMRCSLSNLSIPLLMEMFVSSISWSICHIMSIYFVEALLGPMHSLLSGMVLVDGWFSRIFQVNCCKIMMKIIINDLLFLFFTLLGLLAEELSFPCRAILRSHTLTYEYDQVNVESTLSTWWWCLLVLANTVLLNEMTTSQKSLTTGIVESQDPVHF